MTVKIFEQPNFTAQDAATYKANIDNSIAVLAEIGKQFAPREMATLGMGITVEAGQLQDGTIVPAQNITGIGAPSANPRIDRIYYDLNLRSFQRVVGTEDPSPTPPALPFGVFPICSLYLVVGQISIRNDSITDDRSVIVAPAAFFAGDGYTSIVDAAGLLRFIIGKAGSDNRIIARLQNDTDAKLELQNQSGAQVFSYDVTGKTYYNVASAIHDKVAGGGYYFRIAGTNYVTLTTTTMSVNATLAPTTNNARNLGGTTLIWANVYATAYNFGATTLPKIVQGANTPEGVVTAPVGSLFLRNNGAAATCLYVKETGTGNTGWVAK